MTPYPAGARFYVVTRGDATGYARHYARAVTGRVVFKRRNGVGEPEAHLLLAFEGCTARTWEPVRKLTPASAVPDDC